MKFLVTSNRPIARDIYSMELAGVLGKCRPGQFAHVALPTGEKLLRRPFGIFGWDETPGRMRIVYALRGAGTRLLAQVRPAAHLDVLAPLGNGFAMPGGYRRVWLLGGGVGVAPLMLIPKVYPDRSYRAFFGYRSAEYVIEPPEASLFGDLSIVTEDGSRGEAGLVTDVLLRELKKDPPDAILACGPTPMLRALKEILRAYPDVEAQVSLEPHMGCGTGGCYTCTCLVDGAMKRACVDGPVFDLREVEL